MRTTIRIDDDLYREVKARAAASGRSVAAVIEDALRAAMTRDAPARRGALEALPTSGGSGVPAGVDLASNAAMRDLMDGDEPVDALR